MHPPLTALPPDSLPCPRSGLLLALALGILLATACGSDDARDTDAHADAGTSSGALPPEPPDLTSWETPGPWSVVRDEFEIEDPTREVRFGEAPAETRTLRVTIWSAPEATGASPLIVWAHGLGATTSDNPRIANTLASHGYTVVAPRFPKTNRNTPETDIRDVAEQPGDISLVIDHMLARSADPDDALHGRIDAERIGIGGVSLGALTVLLTAWVPDFRDPRVAAVVALGPPACYLPRPLFSGDPVPMLVMHGDADAIVDYETHGRLPFLQAPAPSVIVRLVDGSHTGLADNYATVLNASPRPDTIGCGTIGSSIPLDELGELAESLGGADAATIEAECRAPCTGDELERESMRSGRQGVLVVNGTVAFFESVFRDGPPMAVLAGQLDAEPDVEARAVVD